MTVFVYAGGFLPLAFEPRYIEPVLWPLCSFLVFDVLVEARALLRSFGLSRSVAPPLFLLGCVCALSLASPHVDALHTSLQSSKSQSCPFREGGQKLAASGCSGPLAVSGGLWHDGLFVAYYASLPCLGEIEPLSVDRVEAELVQCGARSFLVASSWRLFSDFRHRTNWREIYSARRGEDTLHLFVAPDVATGVHRVHPVRQR